MAVAPYTGARIETTVSLMCAAPGSVAPYTGARIETVICVIIFISF